VTDVALRSADPLAQQPAPPENARPRLERLAVRVGLVAVVAVAVGLRFAARSPLWLDEAQSVSIARLPLTGSHTTLFEGLREDGSPPLYYLLLHGWMAIFGHGDLAVRAMSAVLNLIAAVPLYVLALRVVGKRAAAVAVLMYLTSPFALYFATETRMYSLIVLLTALGGLALKRTLRAPSVRSVVALAVCAGLLALTHYWCLYLLLTVAAWILIGAVRGPLRPHWKASLGGLALGVVVFAPWLPAFFYQLKHTGTPWGDPASFAAVAHAYGEWAGGATTTGRALLVIITALVAFGVAGTAVDNRRVLLDLRGHEPGRSLFVIATATLVVAVAVGQLVGNAWADRYTATAFVPFLLVIGRGTDALESKRVFTAVVAAAAILGLYAGGTGVVQTRTQAREAAHVLERLARPGDVLLTCPDQLGPGLSREVPSWLTVRTVPTYEPPQRVDWVNYQDRNQKASGTAVADRALREAGKGHTVFLAASGDYRTYETLCASVRARLVKERPSGDQVMQQRERVDVWENYALLRFRP
jgi:hypothetical protein